MRYGEPAALIARLPAARLAWEPIIVTTLRRYVRKRAPASLVHRLAGGVVPFRLLNETWDIDGTAHRGTPALVPMVRGTGPTPSVDGLGVSLTMDERRIALMQIIVDYARAGEVFPPAGQLGRYLGCTHETINSDLDWLRGQGRIAMDLHSNGAGPRRVIAVVGTDLETAAPERFQ